MLGLPTTLMAFGTGSMGSLGSLGKTGGLGSIGKTGILGKIGNYFITWKNRITWSLGYWNTFFFFFILIN